MSEKRVHLSEVNNIDALSDDTVIVVDDRPLKYDEKSNKIVRPGEQGYDDLPDIERI